MRKIKHNWTKKTMGECAKRFMDDLQHYYFSYQGKYRNDNIGRLIEQYSKIEHSVTKGLNFYEKEE